MERNYNEVFEIKKKNSVYKIFKVLIIVIMLGAIIFGTFWILQNKILKVGTDIYIQKKERVRYLWKS